MTGKPAALGTTSEGDLAERQGLSGWPAASTRLVALLGWPARYSRSPAIHNAAFRHEGLDLVYVAMPCKPDALASVVTCLSAVGAAGANVTVPHKQTVMEFIDELTIEARAVGAVNTLVFSDDGVTGDNTDAAGLSDDWQRILPPHTFDEPVCVVGTGGGARAAVLAAARLGGDVTVIGRRLSAAQEIVADMDDQVQVVLRALHLDDPSARDVVSASKLIVNATPVGMNGERLPELFMALKADQVAYDLIYEPRVTPFLAAARDHGASAFDGLGMLTGQAARAFTAWTGSPAPIGVMERAAGRSSETSKA